MDGVKQKEMTAKKEREAAQAEAARAARQAQAAQAAQQREQGAAPAGMPAEGMKQMTSCVGLAESQLSAVRILSRRVYAYRRSPWFRRY